MALILLFVMHWAVAAFTMFYVFFRKSKQYDWIYGVIVTGIVIHWFFGGECIISYYEKRLLEEDYWYGKDPTVHPSLSLYTNSSVVRYLLGLPVYVLSLYNIYYLMRAHQLPMPLVGGAVGGLVLYGTYFRIKEAMKDKSLKGETGQTQ